MRLSVSSPGAGPYSQQSPEVSLLVKDFSQTRGKNNVSIINYCWELREDVTHINLILLGVIII